MTRLVQTLPLVIGAALAEGALPARLALVFPWTVATLSSLSAMLLYARQAKQSHARLRASRDSELVERRKVEDTLREQEGFYHSLVESLPQSILRKDLDGKFTFANQRFCTSLGRALEQVRGTTDFDYFPRELAEKYRRDDKHVIETRSIFETVEEHVTPHGDKLYVRVIKTPLYDTEGRIAGVQGIFWDVTEKKRDEERLQAQNLLLTEMARSEREAHTALMRTQSQLVEQEKLASLGQMVAGVAHEINNPIAFVTNNVAVLERDVGEMHDLLVMYQEADDLIASERNALFARIQGLRERVDMDYTLANIEGLLDRSREGLKRIHQIVGNLRLFAHLDEGEVNEADLNEGIQSTATIVIGNAKKKGVQLALDLQPLPPITCNAAKINQVVMNLITNAIDASPPGATITIRSRAEAADVRIEVADTGPGIDPKDRDRIFEPFFTTKPVGQGTGLGLSISYGIVQEHGGSIQVESTPGQGTCFTVLLPLKSSRPRWKGRPLGPESPTAAAAPVPAEARR